jgi:hypothetical protein
MSDTNESELAGTKEPLIITPEEAADRLRQRTKPVPDGGKGGKYNISRAEAVSIAASIGQQVYDEIRKEHAMTMQLLQEDLAKHFADIRRTVVLNILDLQHRGRSAIVCGRPLNTTASVSVSGSQRDTSSHSHGSSCTDCAKHRRQRNPRRRLIPLRPLQARSLPRTASLSPRHSTPTSTTLSPRRRLHQALELHVGAPTESPRRE